MFAFGSKTWPGLAKLCEECGEVVQIVGKLMMVKGWAKHWSGNLRMKLIEEMGDVLAAIKFVKLYCLTPEERAALVRRENEKFEKFCRWHDEEKRK
jgi:NTP pyrophosphatase (non-canonical NTP hydrolase)